MARDRKRLAYLKNLSGWQETARRHAHEIRTPLNGEPASGANGGTLGFQAPSTEAVDAWHAAGLANGGTAIEDPPGPRNATGGRVLYLAYLRDPAGNKVCALHRLK